MTKEEAEKYIADQIEDALATAFPRELLKNKAEDDKTKEAIDREKENNMELYFSDEEIVIIKDVKIGEKELQGMALCAINKESVVNSMVNKIFKESA